MKEVTRDISPEDLKNLSQNWIQLFKNDHTKSFLETVIENQLHSFTSKIVEKFNGGVNSYVPGLMVKHEVRPGQFLIFYMGVELGIIEIFYEGTKMKFTWCHRLHHIFKDWKID